MAGRRIGPAQLRRALAQGSPEPAYLFSGPELHLKRLAIGELAAGVPAASREFNVEVFHGFEADLAAVLGAARTVPLLAPRRLVVLRDVEKMRLTEGRGELLEEYLKGPAPETTLVITTESEEKARDLAKRFGAWWTEVVFAPLGGPEFEARLRQEAERLGCALAPAAAAALAEATGTDLARALAELEKLRLAVGPGGAVGEDEVARLVAGYDHQSLEDLLRAISARDLARSLRLLATTVGRPEEALLFLGLLGKRLRLLWFFAGEGRALPPGVRTWPAKPEELRAWGRRFAREEIARGLAALAEVDAALKGGAQVPPRLILESFLFSLLGAGRRAPGAAGPAGPGPAAP